MKICFFGVKISTFLCLGIPVILSNDCFGEDKTNGSIYLQAEINASTAKEQIRKAFGKYSIESPELFENNHQGFEHIQVKNDREVGPCFTFFIHRDLDGDQNKKWPKGLERQRNEIKGYQGSPSPLKAIKHEEVFYSWYLKIDSTFALTHHFCHFFQLKPVGEENSPDPIMTLSGSIRSGETHLEVRCFGETMQYLKIGNWEDCKGKWLKCECVILYAKNGKLNFSIKSLDGSITSSHRVTDFPSWNSNFIFVRPKWGIYRSLRDKHKIKNEEDRIYMNNFLIRKLKKGK